MTQEGRRSEHHGEGCADRFLSSGGALVGGKPVSSLARGERLRGREDTVLWVSGGAGVSWFLSFPMHSFGGPWELYEVCWWMGGWQPLHAGAGFRRRDGNSQSVSGVYTCQRLKRNNISCLLGVRGKNEKIRKFHMHPGLKSKDKCCSECRVGLASEPRVTEGGEKTALGALK